MTKAKITALLTALVGVSFMGIIALTTEPGCSGADVNIPIEGQASWCGTNAQAVTHRNNLRNNFGNYVKEDMNIYRGWLENDVNFYGLMKSDFLLGIDNPKHVGLQIEVVKMFTDYRESLESVFAAKYNAVKNEFDGELIYQYPILREVAVRKFNEMKGENSTFDWFSLGDNTTERVYNLLIQ